MAKILNLDDVAAKEERVLKFRGEGYPMAQMSVGDFIEITRKSEQMNDKASVADQTELLIEMVGGAFPSMPKDVLRSMSFEQLVAVLDFARAVDQEGEGAEERKK
jgi:hypothetical protein